MQSESQKRLLWGTIVGLLSAFAVILVVLSRVVSSPNNNDFIVRIISLSLANYAGWHLFSWLRETFVLMNQYKTVAMNRDASYACAPLTLLSGAGNGGTP